MGMIIFKKVPEGNGGKRMYWERKTDKWARTLLRKRETEGNGRDKSIERKWARAAHEGNESKKPRFRYKLFLKIFFCMLLLFYIRVTVKKWLEMTKNSEE